MILLKCCTQYATKFGELSMATGLEKVSFHSNPKKGQCQRMFKLLHNCTHFTCYRGHAQNLQVRLQQYMNQELPEVQAGFRKGKEIKDQIANICWIIEKAKSSRKISTSDLLTMPKPLTVWITTNGEKFFKRWEYQTT